MDTLTAPQQAPSQEDIRLLAYKMWQRDGCPQGSDLSYWLNAEQQLKRPVQDGQPKQGGLAGKLAGASKSSGSQPH
jgi:hypothetical protein